GQVPRLDPRRIGRVRAGQGDAPAAARTQEAGVQGEAVAGQPVAAVVVEHRRDEVELDVGACVRRQRRADEAARLGDVAGPRAAAAAQVVVEGDAQFAGAVVGDPLGGAVQGADVEVVLQVGADPGGVVQHLDP